MRVFRGTGFSCACGFLVSIVASAAVLAAKPSHDFMAEKMTVARIRRVAMYIETYRLEHNEKGPSSLENLRGLYGFPEDHLRDGWGREFFFYTTGANCVIASFGRDGRPGRQTSLPGGPTPQRDYDSDIVWISGEWAQTPWGIEP